MGQKKKIKKILFVYAADYRYQHVITGIAPPIGILWLIEAIKHKYDCKLVDLSFRDNLVEILNKYRPDIVGVSIRNVQNAANPPKSFLPFLQEIVERIKKNSIAEIVFGGPGFSLYPKTCLLACCVKYGIIGSGTQTFIKFLDSYFSIGVRKDILGLVVNKNSEIVINEGLQEYPSKYPSVDKNIYSKYFSNGKTNYPIQTKRGCNFKCVYCSYPVIEGRKYIKRDIDDIYSEMKSAVDAGINEFFFCRFNFQSSHELLLRCIKED